MKLHNFSTLSVCISALGMLVFGLIYFTSSGYMAYHEAALQLPWEDVPAGYQGIILGLMRSTGGGLIAGAVILSIIQVQFHKSPETWMAVLVLAGGIILVAGSFYAMILFKVLADGHPPMLFATVMGGIFLAGSVSNFVVLKKH